MTVSSDLAALDNPFWSALNTLHADIARVDGAVRRYPSNYAPFLGVDDADADVAPALDRLLLADESVYLLGVACVAPAGWQLEAFQPLAQMVCDAPLAELDGPPILPLDESHRADLLALTALVYPHDFRERTQDLGRYFGIYQDGRLAAIIGERLGTGPTRELSAICTHPDFLGRGYARRLTAMLANDLLARGVQPFLHVSHANARAKDLYAAMGFRVRRDIGFWSLHKPASAA
jgi:ribosomal protein S18 acetylase RimI-like enzyme